MDTIVAQAEDTRRRIPEPSNNSAFALELEDDGGQDAHELQDSSPLPSDIESTYQAWLCVLGAFTFAMPSYGSMHSVGTIQSYLQLNQLQGHSIGGIGWITGIYLFLSYFLAIQIGPICDYDGPMVVGSVGVEITIVSFLLLGECKTYWQFMLCLGVFAALGGAAIATTALSTVAKLFARRRGLAMGLALTGSAVGAVIFPLMLRSILPLYGWKWSMRIIAFTIAGMTVPGLLCFLPYTKLAASLSHERLQKRSETVLDLSAFRTPSFICIATGSFLLEFAIFGIAGLLPTLAVGAGFAPGDGYLLITVVSVCSCFGRMLTGLIADILGPFNILLVTNTFTLLSMASLFVPFANSSRSILYAFSAMWGFGSGSFLSKPPVCMDKTCAARDYGRYFGTMTFFCSFAVLITIALGGLMLENLDARALAGLLTANVFLGGVCYVAARGMLINKSLSPKTKV